MIIDTSALVAVVRKEEGFHSLFAAMFTDGGILPAPVVVEFHRVTAFKGNRPDPDADALLTGLLAEKVGIEAFGHEDAELAVSANEKYGTGNGRGGMLNMLDLMVYGIAKRLDRPLLCTGRDFLSTDIAIHPASRRW